MKLAIALAPLALLAACSPYGVNNGEPVSSHGGSYHAVPAAYSYGSCVPTACAPGQGYSVAPKAHHVAAHHGAYAAQAHHGQVHHGKPQAIDPHAAYGAGVSAPVALAAGLRGRRDFTPHNYGEIGVVGYDSNDDDVYGVQARLGRHFTRHLGAEVEGALGVSDADVTVFDPVLGDITGKVGVDYQVAGFAVGRLPILRDRINLLARAGYHYAQIGGEASGAGVSTSFDEGVDGFAYGAGAEIGLNRNDAIRLDVTRYETGSGDLDAASITYKKKF